MLANARLCIIQYRDMKCHDISISALGYGMNASQDTLSRNKHYLGRRSNNLLSVLHVFMINDRSVIHN